MHLIDTTNAAAASATLTEGRRKVVTMMFADIVNSSSMVIGRDPEAVNDSLLPMLQGMIDSVHLYGGTVLQVLGDGIMAAFGAPDAQEDHALRACLAADHMRREISQWPIAEASEKARGIRLRVGINSGEVLAQELLADRWPEYRAAGEAVYVAARLTQAAKPGVILISAETEAIVRDAVDVGARRMVPLGKQLPRTPAFELVGVHPATWRRSYAVRVPFVGRTRERQALGAALQQTVQGSGHIVVVHGDPGIGKSRLVSEFDAQVSAAGHIVIRTSCFPPHLFVPVPPVAEAMRQALALLGVRTHEDVGSDKGLVQLTPLHRAAIRVVLGGDPGDTQWQALGPTERRHLTLSACVEVFEQLARARQALVLLFEDIHWADSDLSRLIDLLSVRVHLGRTLVVMTRRPGADFQDTPWPSTTVVEVDPLSAAEGAELAKATLGSASHLSALRDLLVDKTGGNPFFLLECVASVLNAGPLTERASAATVQNWVREFAVPRTIQSIIAARIDRLAPADQELLSRASVIGQTFAHQLLARIVPERREQLLAALNRLCQLGFLQRTRVVPHLEFSFKHALIHDVAYGSLPRALRKNLHSQLAAILRSRILQIPNRLALLAQHCLRSEQWAKGFVFGLAAGRDALRRSQHREAVVLLEGAATALGQFPRTERNSVRRAAVSLDLADALFPLGRKQDAEQQLNAAQTAARRSKDGRMLTRTWCSFTLHHWVAGDLDAAHRIGMRALRRAEKDGHEDLRLLMVSRLGAMAIDRGNSRFARKQLQAGLDAAGRNSFQRYLGTLTVSPVTFQAPLAIALAELGQYREAVRFADEAVSAAEASGHLFSQVYALLAAGTVYLQKGDFERSAQILGQSLRLSRSIGSTLLIRPIVSAMGYALLHTGRVEDGCALLEDAVASATPDPVVGQLSQHLGWLALAKLALGKHTDAVVVARRAITLARRNGQRRHEAWAWYALGRAQHALDVSAAARSLERARVIAVACGLTPLAARTEPGWGATEAASDAPGSAPTASPSHRHLRLVRDDEGAPGERRVKVLATT